MGGNAGMTYSSQRAYKSSIKRRRLNGIIQGANFTKITRMKLSKLLTAQIDQSLMNHSASKKIWRSNFLKEV